MVFLYIFFLGRVYADLFFENNDPTYLQTDFDVYFANMTAIHSSLELTFESNISCKTFISLTSSSDISFKYNFSIF